MTIRTIMGYYLSTDLVFFRLIWRQKKYERTGSPRRDAFRPFTALALYSTPEIISKVGWCSFF
jgi:hypothetical protein